LVPSNATLFDGGACHQILSKPTFAETPVIN
jgi:hypothetical protein